MEKGFQGNIKNMKKSVLNYFKSNSSIVHSGGHFVQQSGTILAIFVERG